MSEEKDSKIDIDTPKKKGKKIRVTLSFTKSQLLIGILVAALLVSVFTGGFGFGGSDSGSGSVVAAGNAQPSAAQPSVPERISVSTDDDAVKGDKNAPVTIIEFSDFECPFCGRFYSQTLPSLLEEYIDTGKAKLVYRDYPLPFHSNANTAAEAAECVRAKGGDEAFFEMHDLIFENLESGLSEAKLVGWASDLGHDIQSCLDSGEFEDEIKADTADGQRAGVSGTPSFFIGNDKDGYIKLVGAQPFVTFQAAIDAELA